MTQKAQTTLEGGSYEIIRKRLLEQAGELRQRLQALNTARKDVFGAIENTLIANERIHTANYCMARDMVALGDHCLFGYNVHIGLRSGIVLQDVFSVYTFQDQSFGEGSLDLIRDEKFVTDFQNLYRYYKDAYFARFSQRGRYLYMVFYLSEKGEDIKAFKWLVTDEGLEYIDNRSDHEVGLPEQYEFRWKVAGRDDQRSGAHPHVSILDRVFVETVGGDLTIKVEDNTDDGKGILEEPVEHRDQTLDDAEFHYADLGNLIALKIRPYQEEPRYFIFNEKIQQALRIDALDRSGVLLPDQQGLIFANGYYLQTGEYKVFDNQPEYLQFKKRVVSPNGEDFLFVFYAPKEGQYCLLHYNVIEQTVATPILCHGFSIFPDGEMAYFKAEDEPTKHHQVQIWQTPFLAGETIPSDHTDTYLFKVGNKDLVKAMAECQEILSLTQKEDSYADLYDDLVRRTTDVLDSYYWIGQADTFRLDEPMAALRETARSAIGEFEKKRRQERETREATERVQTEALNLFEQIKRQTFNSIDLFVSSLADLRRLRGELVGLKERKYVDLELVEQLEEQAGKANERLSNDCVHFLMQEEALSPYAERIEKSSQGLDQLATAREAGEREDTFQEISTELELLTEIVSNLRIDDATQTTHIIDQISGLFTLLNQSKATLKRHKENLQRNEATAEFTAQLKLLDQSTINYLDVADTPEKCDDYLSKIMVQLEELESKFVEIPEFTERLAEKREEIYGALEGRKNRLIEARNNRTASLDSAADRILSGIRKRVQAFKEAEELNSFFAADLMVEKVRDLSRQLTELNDSTKANGVLTRLKTLKEDALRQLRDKQDLFVEGQDLIKLGRHTFTVSTQPLELTVVRRGEQMAFHLTGTNFYDPIEDQSFQNTRPIWDMQLPSENEEVYRGEYLAWELLPLANEGQWPAEDAQALLKLVRAEASKRYEEGYVKGIHDEDAAMILSALRQKSSALGLLHYPSRVRACGCLYWHHFLEDKKRQHLDQQLAHAGQILQVFPKTREFDYLRGELRKALQTINEQWQIFPDFLIPEAAAYLFEERVRRRTSFVCAPEAADLYKSFWQAITSQKAAKTIQEGLKELSEQPLEQYHLARQWVFAFLEAASNTGHQALLDEVSCLVAIEDFTTEHAGEVSARTTLEGLRGDHPLLPKGIYELNYHELTDKMNRFRNETQPLYHQFVTLKRSLTDAFRQEAQLDAFKPRVLSSFVRNQLIDQVYLPIFGDNLAKQIGTAGEQTRTDRMGMLLLISPPGYGKTTLMEYIADRLGLIFVKVNGPAIGHQVTGLAPSDAPTMAAANEMEKLNLAFEMGDNIMLYVDDIQHCHPEFLQKFISLCDAQRKIEGVYKGEAKTYDLRGRRVCVVMAGNPYTESGERFQIPDMLANRADIYNLGDIIGDSKDVFELSYLENALTSNEHLQDLAAGGLENVYALLKAMKQGSMEGIELQGNYGPEAIRDFQAVLEKMMRIRDVVLRVNQEYIRSAATDDAFRTEPAFKLQGSYRNMNKLAEKVVPIMNDRELNTLILAHYEGESQTLTSDAEANFLKLKEMMEVLTPEETTRWEAIRATFVKNKRFFGGDGTDRMAQILAQMDVFNESVLGIRDALLKGRDG